MNYVLLYAPVCPIAKKQVAEQVKKWQADRMLDRAKFAPNGVPLKKKLVCVRCRKKAPREDIVYHGYKTKAPFCPKCFNGMEKRGAYGER